MADTLALSPSAFRQFLARRDATARAVIFSGLFVLLVAAALLSVCTGAAALSLNEIFDALSGAGSDKSNLILWAIRLPRTLMAGVIGAALALCGALMQGLFRNPLADPGLTGVSSGAALAAVFVIVIGQNRLGAAALELLPLAAFSGGLAVTVLLYAVSTRHGRTAVQTMLLAGIAFGALAGALTGLLIFLASEQQLREFTFWTLGGLGGATWAKAIIVAVVLLLTLPFWPWLARSLDRLALGEAEAAFAGLNVERVKMTAILFTSLLTGACVAMSGTIGFVGLVVPHVIRLVLGPGHGRMLPAAALLGASLLILSDTVARIAAAPAELPIGILTACLGGPLFLWMLLRDRRLSGNSL
jgi:iron complex transport system permease protein